MRKGMLVGTIGVVSLLILAAISDRAEAVPAFARKYKTACITCHATYPRLTALGEAIRLNGYKMPGGDELYVKDLPVSMGAEAYKQVFPEAVWPSDIPGLPPISIRLLSDFTIDTGGTKASRTEFDFPHELELLAAGSFGENLSFFVEIELEEGETGFEGWLMWEDLFKGALGENRFNIKAGSIGMHEIDLPNARTQNRITREKYLHSTELGLEPGPGVELNGFGRSWRYAVGVVEGDGATSEKDYYGALSFKIGGLGYDGSGGTTEEGGLKTTPAGYWRDDSVLVGVFGYRGKIGVEDKNFDRIGADVRWNHKDLSLAGGFITGDNDATSEKKDIWFAEAEYFVFPWLQPFLRYENLSSDVANRDKARLIAGAVWLARANVRIVTEGRFYTENEPVEVVTGDKDDQDRVLVRLDYAF